MALTAVAGCAALASQLPSQLQDALQTTISDRIQTLVDELVPAAPAESGNLQEDGDDLFIGL